MTRDGFCIPRSQGMALLCLGSAYFCLASVTISFTRYNGGVALVWPATSILLAHVVDRPSARWLHAALVCALASGIATSLFGFGLRAAVPFAVINVVEAIGGAALLRRSSPGAPRFESLREISVVIAVVGMVMPLVCGVFAGLSAYWVMGESFSRNWLDFFTGHALGTITFAPLLMLISGGNVRGWARGADLRERVFAGVCLASVIVTTLAAFLQTHVPLLYLPSLAIIVTVIRIGRLGAAVAAVLLSVTAIACTSAGYGPFHATQVGQGAEAQFLQMYLAAVVLTALATAAELRHRKASFTELQKTSTVARLVLDRSGDVIMHLDVDGRIHYASPSARAITGYEPGDLIGRMPHELIHADDIHAVVGAHRQALADPDLTFIVEYRGRCANDEWVWFEVHTRATVSEAGVSTGVINISHDITARKQAESQLVQQAQTDPLTGLLNRRALDIALEDRESADAPYSIALFDLDRFKEINDTYGHDAGDFVIKTFSDVLKRGFRPDDLVARLGGEEFVAVLDGMTGTQAREICERVRETFASMPIRLENRPPFSVTVSGGIATRQKGSDLWELIAEADAALYQAKHSGRNCLAIAA